MNERYSLDTPIEPEMVLSAANFREVCPEVLSPLAFSLIGAGMEIAFRDIARKTGWHVDGPSPRFVSYQAFRPFHVMSSLEKVIHAVPLISRGDVWEYLLGGPPPTVATRYITPTMTEKAATAIRLAWLIQENDRAATQAMAAVARAEHRAVAAIANKSNIQAGSALEELRTAGRLAWALHTRTTTAAVACTSVLRRVYRREFGTQAADEIIRLAAKRANDAAAASASVGRLTQQSHRLQNYEVADRSRRFRRFTMASAAAQGEIFLSSSPTTRLPETTLLERVGSSLTSMLDRLLAERERSKELGLRALHGVRCLLDAELGDFDASDAALLGVDELLTGTITELQRLIAVRSEELDGASKLQIDPDLGERDGRLISLERPAATLEGSQLGTPLATGFARGVLANELGSRHGMDTIIVGERVDGNYVLAVRPAGVITTFGSVLSHVAIVCRELRIPLVTSIRVPSHLLGRIGSVDGWSGLVTAEDQ